MEIYSVDSLARGATFRGNVRSGESGGQGGLSAQGAEPDGRRYRVGIRPFGISQMTAPVIGAVMLLLIRHSSANRVHLLRNVGLVAAFPSIDEPWKAERRGEEPAIAVL